MAPRLNRKTTIGAFKTHIAASADDETVKVSANDTTEGYLNGKLVAGSGISLAENNDGGNETLTIANTATEDETVKVSANDTTEGYLDGKLVAGTEITLTENNDGGNETLTIASTASASVAEMETGSATDKYVSPGRQHRHPSACKAWIAFEMVGTFSILNDYGVSSVTDNGPGDATVNLDNAFSTGKYSVGGMTAAPDLVNQSSPPFGTTSFRVHTRNNSGTNVDTGYVSLQFFGDQ